MSLHIGQQVGNYRITAEIAKGAFGSVYKAQHIFLSDRIAAIKLLHENLLQSETERELFIKEAQILNSLKHPYILPLYDVGISPEGVPYLGMEYANHGSLTERIRAYQTQALSEKEILAILSQVGQALQYIQKQGIGHRDLKPANILFNDRDEALLADFGIAYVMTTTNTQHAGMAGTLTYMAPEQLHGQASLKSDQYALGCIAYELFTGRRPFYADTDVAMMFMHLQQAPAPLRQIKPQLSPQIEQAILKALAKKTDERFPDIESFINALAAPYHAPTMAFSADILPSLTSNTLVTPNTDSSFHANPDSFQQSTPPQLPSLSTPPSLAIPAQSSISSSVLPDAQLASHIQSTSQMAASQSIPDTNLPSSIHSQPSLSLPVTPLPPATQTSISSISLPPSSSLMQSQQHATAISSVNQPVIARGPLIINEVAWPEILIGNTLEGRYKVVQLVGGASGVYHAINNYLVQDLQASSLLFLRVMKFHPRVRKGSLDLHTQLQNDLQSLYNLQHPNIPQILSVSKNSVEDRYYLMMEFVPGKTLTRRLEENGKPLDEETVIKWVMQCCDIASYLRSIPDPLIPILEPDDIKVTIEGKVIFLDPGDIFDKWKRLLIPKGEAIKLELPFYIDAACLTTDIRHDIGSLGALLYYLLTGETAVASYSPTERELQNKNPLLRSRMVQGQTIYPIAQVIAKAMHKDPTQRFKNVTALKNALKYCLPT